MRLWEMLERYGVITDCKDLNSLEKFIKAGQLGAVTQAKHLEQMSAALKDRADQFNRKIEDLNPLRTVPAVQQVGLYPEVV